MIVLHGINDEKFTKFIKPCREEGLLIYIFHPAQAG